MRFLFLSLWLLATPALADDICAPDYAARYQPIEQRYEKALIFRVEQCGKPASHIFGTMHSDDSEILIQSTPAFNAAAQARIALFELVMTPHLQAQAAAAMQLPPQQTQGLKDMIGEAKFEKLAAAMHATLPEQKEAINRFTPWAAAILLQIPETRGNGMVLDDRLQQYARQHGASISGLETPEEQFGIFQKLTQEQQVAMLTDTLDHLDEIKKDTEEMQEAYKKKDLRTIEKLGEDSFNEIEDKQLEAYLRAALVVDRNREMVHDLLPEMEKGNTFVAVGALHLPGREGILHLLEEKGYFISSAEPGPASP